MILFWNKHPLKMLNTIRVIVELI